MKFTISTLIFIILYSCMEIDCEALKKDLSNEECNLVVRKPPGDAVWFEAEGYDPITKEPKVCKTSNRWWNIYYGEIAVGDTIVKRKGELTFNIHSIDTIITHTWACK